VDASYAECSLANSAGIVAWPTSHLDWVRPGIMLYGATPLIGQSAVELGLKPVMTLESRLIAVHLRKRGEAVGYGGDWVCPEDMPVGVVAIGYGDGYPRHAPPGTPVAMNGARVPLIGRVSMDMITLDLRTQPQARVGDPVVLWGADPTVDEIATLSGTVSYELLCCVTPRIPRVAQ
jgi:alanine racemase